MLLLRRKNRVPMLVMKGIQLLILRVSLSKPKLGILQSSAPQMMLQLKDEGSRSSRIHGTHQHQLINHNHYNKSPLRSKAQILCSSSSSTNPRTSLSGQTTDQTTGTTGGNTDRRASRGARTHAATTSAHTPTAQQRRKLRGQSTATSPRLSTRVATTIPNPNREDHPHLITIIMTSRRTMITTTSSSNNNKPAIISNRHPHPR